ncbi:MAG: transposase, partial [Candidatus Riflebacteria bacterium]
EFCVMPNHFHGIIWIVGNGDAGNGFVGNGRDRSLRDRSVCDRSVRDRYPQNVKIKPIPELIGAFKTTSSKLIHNAGKINFKWQKSYYDVIIRDNESLLKISEYIKNNPKHWNSDDYFDQ